MATKETRNTDEKGRKLIPTLVSIFINPDADKPSVTRIDLDSALVDLSDGETQGHKRERLPYERAIELGVITAEEFGAAFSTFEKVIDAMDWIKEQDTPEDEA